MKKILLLFLLMIVFVACGDSSSHSTPFIPPVIRTFPVRVEIVSYALPVESKNWKYAISDNISNTYRNNYARANYLAERVGNPTDYLCF